MSNRESNPPVAACPPTTEDLRRQAHERLDEILNVLRPKDPGARDVPRVRRRSLARTLAVAWDALLIQFFLQPVMIGSTRRPWQAAAIAWQTPAAGRTLKTGCGPVAYVRAFLVPRHGGGARGPSSGCAPSG